MAILGRKWVVVILRELLLSETTRFDDIVYETGIPRDILSGRLRDLEEIGLLMREQYSEHPPRYEYRLTEQGKDLYGVVQSIRAWGDKHLRADPEFVSEFVHDCGEVFHALIVCSECGRELKAGDSRVDNSFHRSDALAH
ncbi:winged helix-turn-helix transcriptional regulator [Microbacterium rhizomatis]|nr:helix-turn-helix domain-containing protein [Microbacterium rhizomatis]